MKPMQKTSDGRRPSLSNVVSFHPKNGGSTEERILYVEGVSVHFDGLTVLDDLSLSICSGELRCLIGPNGAGKSTLIDVITGRVKPNTGRVFLGQTKDLTKLSEVEIVRAGVGRKFQKPTVFPQHTVMENLELAVRGKRGVWSSLFCSLSSEQKAEVDRLLVLLGLENRRNWLGGALSHGQKQWLSIGMLLAQDPKVLLVDEPVAGMTEAEIVKTAELLKSLRGNHTVVVIEHDMHFIRSIAETVTVLHQGQILAEGTIDIIQDDVRVRRVYLGH